MFKKAKKETIDPLTKNAPWYLGDVKSDVVKTKIKGTPDGTFIIRNSSTEPGKYVLAYSKEGGVKNLHINGEPGKVGLSKSTQVFDCMSDLVKFYSNNVTEELPLQLIGADFSELPPEPPKSKAKAKEKPKKEKKAKKGPVDPSQPGAQWTVTDVCDWLESIHLKEYISVFKKQKVDGIALLSLNDNDLRDLGVGAFGARKKLTQAITTLNQKFKDMKEGKAPPGLDGNPTPVTTVGLIARNINGVVKIFDVDTGAEVFDIAAHQAERMRREANGGNTNQSLPPPPRPTNGNGNGGEEFGDNDHLKAEWFDRAISKAKATDMLSSLSDGEFVVYSSGSNPGCYQLSYVINGSVEHKLIEPVDSDAGGVQFRGSDKAFPNLSAIVSQHTKSTGGVLKCSLVYPLGPRNLINELPSWNCMDLDKPTALAKIQGKSPGAFVLRPSDKSYAALSLIKPDGSLYHQHIEESAAGLQLKKSTLTHKDLDAFVAHYSKPDQTDLPHHLVV